ncbi:MAG: hypothetical protein QXW94_02280 [Desulfurococcaceae archaeon]
MNGDYLLDYIIMISISLLSGTIVTWYFIQRRRLAKFIKEVTLDLESSFKPVDKTYTLLGYLVGYHARYVLKSGDKVYILLTTTPKISFIYSFVAKWLGRSDRLEIAIEGAERRVLRDLHIVLELDRIAQRTLQRDLKGSANTLLSTSVEISGRNYIAYYVDAGDLRRAVRLLQSSGVQVRRLSAFKSQNLTEIVADIKPGNTLEVVKLLREFSKVVSRD